jgi:hypothetical protein
MAATLPDPYGRELKGIAAATGIPLGRCFEKSLILAYCEVTGRRM